MAEAKTGYMEKTAAEVKKKLEAYTVRLQKAGFNAGNSSTRIIVNVESRAGAVVELAEKEHFSTIVLATLAADRRGTCWIRLVILIVFSSRPGPQGR